MQSELYGVLRSNLILAFQAMDARVGKVRRPGDDFDRGRALVSSVSGAFRFPSLAWLTAFASIWLASPHASILRIM